MAKHTTTKKKPNPSDLTLRNLRAEKARNAKMAQAIVALGDECEHLLGCYDRLEDRVIKLEQIIQLSKERGRRGQ